ncbi:MAG: hypothetical protein IBJ09_06335 [Bacteroidia bacterium]|nr:hypothetical protein [Bacteroidia bacterium]
MRLHTHIYVHGLWLLLLCLAGCAKDKADPPLSDAEKQLLGKWYLQRSEKTMYVPSLGPDVLGDYYNWNDAGEGWIEFRENREMAAGTVSAAAGVEYFSHWELNNNQLKGTLAGGTEMTYTLQLHADTLHITEPHSPDHNLHFRFGRQAVKFFFPSEFTPFLGNWHMYQLTEYDLNGQVLNTYAFPDPNSSLMILQNSWFQQQGYTYTANCYQCPADNTWKPLQADAEFFIYSGHEYYDVLFSDNTHMEVSFPSLHFPLQGANPGKTYLFKMEKQ